MKLFFSPTSPFVRKCMVVAHEVGLDQRIELLPCKPNALTPDANLSSRNPLGKIPTFFTDDGEVLFDSGVVCEYLDTLGGGQLFPRSGAERWRALTLQALGDGMLEATVLARYEETMRPEHLRYPEWRAAQLGKVEKGLKFLESEPQRLAGPIDIGKITVGCSLRFLDLRFAEWEWRGRAPGVAAWYAGFSQRASMQKEWALPGA